MRQPGLTISCVVHAVALGWGLVAISAAPMQSPPVDSLPVDFISEKDFSQLTQGVKNAPKLKLETPKPLADKADAPKPVKELAQKVADKPEITTDSATPKAQPEPQPEKPDKSAAQKPKPEAKPPQKPDKPDKPKTPELKPDQIADLLKKHDAKNPPKPQDKPPPEKPAHDTPKFDANQVAQLLDKRDPRRQFAAAEVPNSTANLGSAAGQAAQLSQSEIDALRAQISQCWNPPAGVDVSSKLYVVLRVLFKQDGSMVQEPVVVEGSASTLGPALAESAKRALLRCQPFTMLRPEHYQQWKDIEVKFDPHELLGG